MKEVIVKVEGMSCGHCKQSVEAALNEHQAVERAEVDLGLGQVTIQFDQSATNEQQLEQIIENQGYDVIS
ncbi:cation transporter [Amphibacillus sediminis]|uniref:cation transporter n=1 Tax=Amphibacillus sediminis TaxID=360185 RepID=UPI00082D2A3A|nr:cation transporter [Amphibacillus sediminis]